MTLCGEYVFKYSSFKVNPSNQITNALYNEVGRPLTLPFLIEKLKKG
jgi:hypothetical protein